MMCASMTESCLVAHRALGYQACFQKFFLCAGEHSLLLRNFCFYHIVSPGYDQRTHKALTLAQMEEQVKDVVKYFNLQNPTAIGAGTGDSRVPWLSGDH